MPTLDVIDLYAKLRLAADETERARLIAHALPTWNSATRSSMR